MTIHNSFTMPIPPPVSFVLERLCGAGYTAYCVGGCVRDCLMGKTPSDYDVTTSAKPDEMQVVFSDCRVVETGLKHGTLTVVTGGMNIEITTYRIDGAYGDCRHPENVTFTDRLSDDLCRRDFTVNAMAYSPCDGLIDLYGGQDDLGCHVIRCVGRARERFTEDGLRMLRALRFSSTLGFTPDRECADAIHELTPLLGKISRERIYSEMTKLLTGKNSAEILYGFPDTVGFSLGVTAEEIVRAADMIEKDSAEPDALMRYALLLSGLETKKAEEVFDSLKPSRDEKKTVLVYLRYRGYDVNTRYDALRLMHETYDGFPIKLARFRSLLGISSDENERERVASFVREIIGDNLCRSFEDLRVNGNDLSEIGMTGKEIGSTLRYLLDRVMRGSLPNEHEPLLEEAEKLKK